MLRVVLFCKGRGADASSYKPYHDESQWWNRRDALVRCVAAFLYGPISSVSSQQRELVLIFEDDLCAMKMSLEEEQKAADNRNMMTTSLDVTVVPTEQAILKLWKQAASNPGVITCQGGVTCRMDYYSETTTTPTNMDSKRQILEYLQKHCSIQFLRKHGLNSSATVILRKTNKKHLMGIWNLWNNNNAKNSTSTITNKNKQETLAFILQDLLKPMNNNNDSAIKKTTKVVAGILHESSECELPCFHVNVVEVNNNNNTLHNDLHVCLFLGAVRDMYRWENRILKTCCLLSKVPLVPFRVGPVPEFTSKILSVVAYHHAQERLGPAILCLCNDNTTITTNNNTNNKSELLMDNNSNNKEKQDDAFVSWNNNKTCCSNKLHVVCSLPLLSSALSCDVQHRSSSRLLWALVRVTVCTLWRSRLASSSSNNTPPTTTTSTTQQSSPLQNTLTIVFEDGLVLSLEQEDFLTFLAYQHQAAPCEYQILQALVCKKRDAEAVVGGGVGKKKWNQEYADKLMESMLMTNDDGQQQSLPPVTFALDLQMNDNDTSKNDNNLSLVSALYSLKRETTMTTTAHKGQQQQQQLVAFLRIHKDSKTPSPHVVYDNDYIQLLQNSCKRWNIPILRQQSILGVSTTCKDEEGATITMLQHFMYQGRLFLALEEILNNSFEKRKSNSNNNKKKKKRHGDKKSQKEHVKKKKTP